MPAIPEEATVLDALAQTSAVDLHGKLDIDSDLLRKLILQDFNDAKVMIAFQKAVDRLRYNSLMLATVICADTRANVIDVNHPPEYTRVNQTDTGGFGDDDTSHRQTGDVIAFSGCSKRKPHMSEVPAN